MVSWRRYKVLVPLLFVSPTFVLFLIFRIFPIFYAVYFSFFDWQPIFGTFEYVGLDNYVKLLDPTFIPLPYLRSLLITFQFAIGTVIGVTVLSLMMAVVINQIKRFKSFFTTIYFLPVVATAVAVGYVWRWMFERLPMGGLINYMLNLVGVPAQPWIHSPLTSLLSVGIVFLWMQLGWNMVIFWSGLQSIPESLYDSAVIDGANMFQRFRHVTLPLIRPITGFVVVMTTLASLQVFDIVYVITWGGPQNSTQVAVLWIYNAAFRFFEYGTATAGGVVLFIIILMISIVQLRAIGLERRAPK